MINIKRFSSLNDIFKDALKKLVPELAERNDFEVEYRKDILTCTGCNQTKIGAYFYKLSDQNEWIQVKEKLKCSSCRDAEAFEAYQSQSLQNQNHEISERLMNDYFLIPDDLKEAGFKNYEKTNQVTSKAKLDAWAYAKRFIEAPTERHNLLIMGSPGTGKSHLCAAISRYVREKGLKVGFLTTGALLSKIKSTYQKGAARTEQDIFSDLKKFDLLVLDDIGSEATSNDDWRKTMIFEVVNSRIGKPTIYTSNLNDKQLPNAVGERVFSRLYNNTKFIDLFTDDYRKTLKL